MDKSSGEYIAGIGHLLDRGVNELHMFTPAEVARACLRAGYDRDDLTDCTMTPAGVRAAAGTARGLGAPDALKREPEGMPADTSSTLVQEAASRVTDAESDADVEDVLIQAWGDLGATHFYAMCYRAGIRDDVMDEIAEAARMGDSEALRSLHPLREEASAGEPGTGDSPVPSGIM